MIDYSKLKSLDNEIYDAIISEYQRQKDHLELIASENYASVGVMMASGSILTNKYAEGYPRKRYYGGCEFVDNVESLAIERVKKLFNADYANVQPHSGSQANAAAYAALINPGDKILAMSLSDGGHLTHGSPVSFSGKIYKAVHYGINAQGKIDYDEVAKLAKEHKPKLIMTGFSAYSGIVDWQKFRDIADEIGASMVADISHISGLIAAGIYPSPVNIADVTTSTTHKTLRGPRGGIILAKSNPDLEKKLNSAIFPGYQGGPLMHIIAAKAVAFKEAMNSNFIQYQKQVVTNAQLFTESLIERGYQIVSGGTHNHMFLIDLINKNITGKDADKALGLANITVNKNSVPNDPQSPFVTSGIRIGSAAVTTRGFKDDEAREVGHLIADVLDNIHSEKVRSEVKARVKKLTDKFPIYS